MPEAVPDHGAHPVHTPDAGRAFCSRRRFLALLGGAGSLFALNGGGALAAPPAGLQAGRCSGRALGTEVTLLALHPRRATAQAAADAAFAELVRVDRVMSIYRPESELSRLNRLGTLARPDAALVAVLRRAAAIARQSGGAFDVTVQPLWEAYAEAQRAGRLPEPAAVQDALRRVDWRRVEVSPERITLKGQGTAVTLNGIAQGYAADRALAALRAHGIQHALVNTGEIGALGRKADGSAWTVGIQHPRRADAYVSLARLAGRCMATSGDYATSFSADRAYNHLFDPATGRSPETFASVTVVAQTGTDADALSTAVFVLGTEKGLRLIEATPGADALFVLKDGRVLATPGFPRA